MCLSLGFLSVVLLGQQPSVGKAVIFCKQEPRSTLQVEAWYGTAEMMEKLKWEERAEASSSPMAAGCSVFGVSTFLWNFLEMFLTIFSSNFFITFHCSCGFWTSCGLPETSQA